MACGAAGKLSGTTFMYGCQRKLIHPMPMERNPDGTGPLSTLQLMHLPSPGPGGGLAFEVQDATMNGSSLKCAWV
eukprot:1157179-Pelagomonas_calceolata.AAC.15